MNNNKWKSINHLLSAHNLDGRFNNFAYNQIGMGFISRRKKFGLEFQFEGSAQSCETNSRYYYCENDGIKWLLHSKIINHHRFLLTFITGMSIQELNLEIDSVTKPGLNFTNYFSSYERKDMIYVPLALDLSWHFLGHRSGGKTKSPVGLLLGLRIEYNIKIHEGNWIQNGNSYSQSLMDPNYFEGLIFGGFSFH